MDCLVVGPSLATDPIPPSKRPATSSVCLIRSRAGLLSCLHKRTLRIHFPFISFEALGCKPGDSGTREETFYEDLYETENKDLLPKYWLWKRNDEWILKIDDHSEPGTSVFVSKRGPDAVAAMSEILGVGWKQKIEVLVSLKTRRFYVNESRWVDFTCWSKWRRGYYAVQTVALESGQSEDELVRLSQDNDFFPLPSKAMACLYHLQPDNFVPFFSKVSNVREEELSAFVCRSEAYITEIPNPRWEGWGPKIEIYYEEGFEEDDEEDENPSPCTIEKLYPSD